MVVGGEAKPSLPPLPPMLIINGVEDSVTSSRMSSRFAAKLSEYRSKMAERNLRQNPGGGDGDETAPEAAVTIQDRCILVPFAEHSFDVHISLVTSAVIGAAMLGWMRSRATTVGERDAQSTKSESEKHSALGNPF
mmetsp:Transcript_31037/g.75689  ORF Transcript_31037/g.75689 Transcript_31037/m.75689 type:complete len:136 (-) Transcript_31037:151-558(-)